METGAMVILVDMERKASIAAIGPIEDIFRVKDEIETDIKNIGTMFTDIGLPKNVVLCAPEAHVLILDRKYIDLLCERFSSSSGKRRSAELYNVVQDISLVENM